MSHWLKRTLLLSLILSTLFGVQAYAMPPEWCVRVFVNDKDDRRGEAFFPESIGSGTLVSSTLVVTNWHVVRDRKSKTDVQVMFPDWTVAEDAEVIAQDRMWDLAIIRIRTTTKKPIEWGEDPKVDRDGKPETVAHIHGYGYGVYATGSGLCRSGPAPDEKFFGTEEADDLIVIRGVGARRGDSGGGVTDKDGKYIGTLNASNGRETLFIVQSQVRKLLAANNITLEIPPQVEDYDLTRSRDVQTGEEAGTRSVGAN